MIICAFFWAKSTRRSIFPRRGRSEEHTSELQSRQYLVCRLLLEKKKTNSCSLFLLDSASLPPSLSLSFFSYSFLSFTLRSSAVYFSLASISLYFSRIILSLLPHA